MFAPKIFSKAFTTFMNLVRHALHNIWHYLPWTNIRRSSFHSPSRGVQSRLPIKLQLFLWLLEVIVVFWCIFSILCKGMQRGEHQTKYVLKSEVRCEVSFLRGRSLSRIFFRTHGLKSSDSLNSTSRRSAYREAMVKQFLDVSWSTTCDTMSIMW